MAKVKIIFPGYFSTEDEGRACSNVILVQDQGLNIIVDPGTLPDQQVLLDKLQAEGLTPADIDIVYITHSHLDHYRNIGMFSRAKTLDFYGWREDLPEDDPYGTGKEKLAENPRMVLAAANWVIPGHGARFKADK